MRTKEDWTQLLDKRIHWRQRYEAIEQVIREHLAEIPPNHTWTTRLLVESMCPSGGDFLHELYRVVGILAGHGLAGYCIKGTPYPLYGRMVTPLVWRHTDFGSVPVPSPVVTNASLANTLERRAASYEAEIDSSLASAYRDVVRHLRGLPPDTKVSKLEGEPT
jgi:hypothetical protein